MIAKYMHMYTYMQVQIECISFHHHNTFDTWKHTTGAQLNVQSLKIENQCQHSTEKTDGNHRCALYT